MPKNAGMGVSQKPPLVSAIMWLCRLRGTDRMLASGYFCVEMAQENLIKASSIPYTIVRATQFSNSWAALPSRPLQIRQRRRAQPGCLGELVIKGPDRLTAIAKPCSLLGRWDSGFIGSRVKDTEARINRKYRNSKGLCKKCVKKVRDT